MSKTDTHFYDGKLREHFFSTRLSTTEKQKYFTEFLENKLIVDSTALDGVNLIIRDIGAPNNFDSTNNIWADDLLAEICIILKKMQNLEFRDIVLNILAEQMIDMITTGTCSQGRCTRLTQIYNLIKFENLNLNISWNFVEDQLGLVIKFI